MGVQEEKYHIDRIKAGDREAFSWVVEQYKDMVYTVCLRMLTDEDDASDAAQEVFIKTYKSIGGFQEKSKFSTWVYRIAYNHCVSVIRRKVKVIDLVDELDISITYNRGSYLPFIDSFIYQFSKKEIHW